MVKGHAWEGHGLLALSAGQKINDLLNDGLILFILYLLGS